MSHTTDNQSLILENERLDDLQIGGLKVLQNPSGYCFTSDSVLLSSFCKVKKGEMVYDFCTGSGVVALLLSAKNSGYGKIYGVELQPRLADMASRSVSYNGLNDKIEIINCTVQELHLHKQAGSADVVTCNPPYSKTQCFVPSSSEEIAKAKQEICITLPEIIEAARKLLRHKGRFYMVHQASRAAELMYHMVRLGISPKTVRCVQAKADRQAHLVLIEGIRGGNCELKWQNPLIIYDQTSNYTAEARKFYNINTD